MFVLLVGRDLWWYAMPMPCHVAIRWCATLAHFFVCYLAGQVTGGMEYLDATLATRGLFSTFMFAEICGYVYYQLLHDLGVLWSGWPLG